MISKANAANDTNRLYSLYHDSSGNAEFYMYDTSMNNTIKLDTTGTSHIGALTVNGIMNATNYKINGAQGSDGQVLTSTGSGVAWEDAQGGVSGSGVDNRLAVWSGTTSIDSDADFYVSGSTLHVNGLQVTADNNFYREYINSATGSESFQAGNGWHRIIEISGGTGRGKCHFLIQTGGGSGTPCRVEAIVNTAWSNANSTLTILHSSYPNFITDIRVVRNSTSGKSFVDIKGTGEDYVEVTILPDGSVSASVVNFTNVNSLPSGDSKQIEKTITNMIMSLATGTGSNTSGETPFQVKYDGSIITEKVEVNGGQIITPGGVNLGLNPNTGIVSVGGVVQASGTGNNTFAGDVYIADNKGLLLGTSGDAFIKHTGGSGAFSMYNDVGAMNIVQRTNDGNIVFTSDDGNGGTFDYFSVDGGSTTYANGATTAAYTKWQDKSRIALGSGKDLQLYHDGSDSYITNATGNLKVSSGAIFFSTDSTYLTNFTYTFRDAVGITNPNSTSAASSGNTVMSIGARSGGTVNTSLITTGAVGIGTDSPAQKLHVVGTQVRLDNNSGAGGGYYLHDGSGNFRSALWDNGTNTRLFADGNGSTAAITIDSNNATFAGNVLLQGDGGNAQKYLAIYNEGTATHDDVAIGFKTHGSRQYTIGIDRSTANFTLSNLYASVSSGALLTVNNDGRATFTEDIVAAGIYVGSRNASYDFYNNGTSYLNGATTIDDTLTMSGTQAQINFSSFKGVRLKDNTIQLAFELPYFTHGTSNLAADILLGNNYINGIIELTLTSGYSHQNAVGEYRFKWIVGLNTNGTIWYTPQLIERRITHQGPSQIYVADPAWDSTNSRYYIRVYHKNSNGNQWEGHIKYTSQGVAQNLISSITTTGLLTSTSTSNTHPVGHFLSDQTGDMNLILQSKAAGDPTLTFNSEAANRSGMIKFQDNGTQMGQINYSHNGDVMEFYTGGTGSGHKELTLNETTGATFRGDVIVPNGKISTIGGNNLTISGTVADHCGLSFATNAILPCTVSATNTNTVDLGATSETFKDLHIGGTIYAPYLRLSATANAITITSHADGGSFLNVNHSGNESWMFKAISGSGSEDWLTIGTTSGVVHIGEDGDFKVDGDLTVNGSFQHPVNLIVNTLTAHNARTKGTSANEEFPIGHWNEGEEVFSIDPTWSETQLQNYFGSSNVTWLEDSTAPSGYAIKIDGSVNVGVDYGSGFPHIAIEEDAIYYMECHIRGFHADSVVGHYMGSIDVEHDFSSPPTGSGNPGSYGYWVMGNTSSNGTTWSKRSGIIRGFSDSTTGAFETAAKYWTPQALFNYSYSGSQRACVISGWRVVKISKQRMLTDGSIAAPSLTFAEDQNTGLFRPAADQLGFTVGGSRKMYMTATKTFFQNQANGVEINNGVTVVSGGVDVTGNSTFSGSATYHKIQTYYSGDYTSGFKFSDYNGGIWYDAGNDDLILNGGHANSQIIFNSGNSLALTLDSSQNATFTGNVSTAAAKRISIGTWDNSAFTGGAAEGYFVEGTTPMLILEETDQSKTGYMGMSGGNMYVGGVINNFYVQTNDGSTRLTIDSSGDVAIPTGKKIKFDGASGHTYIMEEGDNNMKFYVGGTEHMAVGGGDVWIQQPMRITQYIYHTGDLSTQINFENSQITIATSGGSHIQINNDENIYFRTNGTNRFKMDTSGNFIATADIIAYGSVSDVSYKENIKPITGALNLVDKLQGVTFDWKEDTDTNKMVGIKEDIGFIAQDVEKVLPTLVRENENGKLSIRDKGIVPVLVEAIKELKAEIEELKKQIK